MNWLDGMVEMSGVAGREEKVTEAKTCTSFFNKSCSDNLAIPPTDLVRL